MKSEEVDVAEMVTSVDPAQRLQALRLMRQRIEVGILSRTFLDLARTLIADPDNDCRWQAVIVVGEYVEDSPEEVWQVISQFGESQDEDMRVAIATVLLEHLLESHFDAYFPRLRERVQGGSLLLADTLSRCWAFGRAEARWGEVEALLIDSRL
jgi:hypothetical protein